MRKDTEVYFTVTFKSFFQSENLGSTNSKLLLEQYSRIA